MHTHVSALNLTATFLGVVIIGTFWRLGASHAATSEIPWLQRFGEAMAFAY